MTYNIWEVFLMKTINVVAAILKKDNKILIAKRGYGEFKGMYEFPGGKIERGEDPEEALKRELWEEMKVHIEVDSFFYHVHYQYPTFLLEMDCYICHLLDDHITLLEHMDYQWITPKASQILWVPADVEVFEEIIKRGI